MKWLFPICIALAVVGGEPAALSDNPAYRAWAAFKPGSLVVISTITMQGDAKQADLETVCRLIEVRPDKVIVESTISMEAGDSRLKLPPDREEIPSRIAADKAPAGRVVEEADETLDVGGKTIRTHRTKRVLEQGSTRTETTTWTSGQAPGGLVREVTVIQGKSRTVTRTELLRFEPVE